MAPQHTRRRSSLASKDGAPFSANALRLEQDAIAKEVPTRTYMPHDDQVSVPGAKKTKCDFDFSQAGTDNIDDLESWNEDEGLSLDSIRATKDQLSLVGERMKWWRVFAMHFLFTWNVRTYEYASIVLVSLAFPNSLFAASLRGITSTAATMLYASAVGSWIDRAPSRLPPLLLSIVSNHGAIVASYLCWLLWPMIVGYQGDDGSNTPQTPVNGISRGILFGIILLLDAIEDLSAAGNLLSLQRDWVPILVGPAISDTSYGLTQINAIMTRIDLICKLVAPSLLPIIVSTSHSRTEWIMLLMVVTILLWTLEIWCARVIAKENEQLRLPKTLSDDEASYEGLEAKQSIKLGAPTWSQKLCYMLYEGPRTRFKHYFSMSVWPASMVISVQQMSVLAYSSTLITFLLEAGYSLSAVTIARGTGSTMAVMATFITPVAANYLRKRYMRNHNTSAAEMEGKVVRTVGLWGVSSQFFFMIPVVAVLMNLSPKSATQASDHDSKKAVPPHVALSVILFSFLSLTRIGHWMYYLMVAELEQVEIPASQRSTFAGTEETFRSLFELGHWAATMVWSRPEDFRWLAMGNVILMGVSTAVFAVWLKKEGRIEHAVRYEEIGMDDVGPTDADEHHD